MIISDKKYEIYCKDSSTYIDTVEMYGIEVIIYYEQYEIFCRCSEWGHDEIQILDTDAEKIIMDTEPTDITLQSILAKPQVKSARK